MATLAGRRPSPRTHSLFVLLMSLSYADGLRTSLLPMSQWIFPQAESVTSQSQTLLNTNDCSINSKGRRDLMKGALLGASLFTASMIPAATFATTSLVQPPQELLLQYDLPRDPRKDAGFAQGMATGMRQYESAVAAKKEALFKDLLQSLPESPVVLELGIGSFPNARYYESARRAVEIIGVDPNDSMQAYALRAAKPLESFGSSVRVVHGVAEALPFNSGTLDAVVSTLTLCSVPDPARALEEVKRVLKPGGRFLFLEHVLSETDPLLAEQQRLATPLQVAVADGCHLNRQTLYTIKAAGFRHLDAEYFDLQGFFFLNPTVAGIATL